MADAAARIAVNSDGTLDVTADPIPGAVWTLRELRSPDGVTGAVGLAEPASRRGPFRERSLPLTYWWTYTLRGAKGAEATVTWADIQAAAGTPTPAPEPGNPAPARTPYGLLGGDWYLTLPTGKPGSPDTVRQPALGTYSSDWFRLNDTGDGVVFTARCDGVTTKNSKYPRSELRQMTGDQLAGWDNLGTGQTLTVEQAITAVPSAKPEVVAAQIHDADDDVCEVMLSGRALIVSYDDGERAVTLDPNYVLGTRYRLQIVAANGRVQVSYNGALKASLPLSGSGWYWKAGAYVQSNPSKGDAPTAVGQVVVYRLAVER